jgi:hypothetical protein
MIKMRAIITVNVDAENFTEAAAAESKFQALAADLQRTYPSVEAIFQQRKDQAARTPKIKRGRRAKGT